MADVAKMTPWFTARERFDPTDGDTWNKYVAWSGLKQLDELISLDFSLCPLVLKDVKDEYWDYVADFRMFGFFTDLDFLKTQAVNASNYRLICAVLNPQGLPQLPSTLRAFEFLGFDLLEVEGTTSALTNCGGFPLAFANSELSSKGLITSYERAEAVRHELRVRYPEEPHAECDLWAVFVEGERLGALSQPPAAPGPGLPAPEINPN
ncbi:MAG: hypothetical protein K2P58_05460 [Hyphomonadaceae bacterium]|nr:hypothetical protein [Hyphomonadaceae bacterium]